MPSKTPPLIKVRKRPDGYWHISCDVPWHSLREHRYLWESAVKEAQVHADEHLGVLRKRGLVG